MKTKTHASLLLRKLLDRGWGKPAQPVTGKNGEEDIAVTIRTIIGEKK